MHDEDDFFNLSKGSLPKPVQSKSKPIMTTYSTKAAKKNAALMSSVASAGPSTRVINNQRRGAPSPLISSPHDSASSSSSSDDASDPDSDSDDVDMLMGTQERKEKRKKGLKKLKKSRKEKQSKPRRQTTPPTESSKKLGKRRIIDPSEDSEVDELASSPGLPPSSPLNLPSPPKVDDDEEEEDFQLPPPPKPAPLIWKPKPRPSRGNEQLQLPDTPRGKGIPPIESDKTLPGSTGTSEDASTPPPPSYMLPATQFPASIRNRTRQDSPEDFALPPPLQKTEPEWEDLDEEIDQLEPTAAPAVVAAAAGPNQKASSQPVHQPTPPRPSNTRNFAPDSDAMDGFDDLVAAAEQGDDYDFGGNDMMEEDMPEPPADMLRSASGPSSSSTRLPYISRNKTSTVKSSIAPWNILPAARSEAHESSPTRSGDTKTQSQQKKQTSQVSANASRDIRQSGTVAKATSSQAKSRQSDSQVKQEGESPALKHEDSAGKSKKNTPATETETNGASLENLALNRSSAVAKRKSNDANSGKAASSRKKQTAFVLQDELHQEEEDMKDVEEEQAQCSFCRRMFPLAVLDSHEQEEQDLLDAKSVKVAKEMSTSAGPTSSAVRRNDIAKQAAQQISEKIKAKQQARDQQADTPQQANHPFRRTVNAARPPLQKEPTREELEDELFPPSPARFTTSQKGKKRARSPEPAEVLQPRQQQHRLQSPVRNVPHVNQRVTRSGQQKIQQGNRRNAGNVIEIDDDEEAGLWEDDDIPEEAMVQNVTKASTLKQPARANIPNADEDSDDGTPPAGSIYLSKIPAALRDSYYRILGLDENGKPCDEPRPPKKKKKAAKETEDWDDDPPPEREKSRKPATRGRKTWWGGRGRRGR